MTMARPEHRKAQVRKASAEKKTKASSSPLARSPKARKRKTKTLPEQVPKPNPNRLEFARLPDESDIDATGRNVIRPTVGAGLTIKAFSGKYGDDLAVMAVVKALSDKAQGVIDGDMKGAEMMLTTQAYALDALFNELAQRASHAETVHKLDVYLRIALKAQSQCRTTLEALSEIKNPRAVAFFRQANIANGPQQVNNGQLAPRAGETKNEPSKLLELQHGERMDASAPAAAVETDSDLATVGEIDRACNTCRQS
jgi:hypothetical protein